jgi:hypothetical protein
MGAFLNYTERISLDAQDVAASGSGAVGFRGISVVLTMGYLWHIYIYTGWWFGTMELEMTFHSVGNFIMPTDKVHHFSEGLAKNHQPAMDFLRFLQRNLLWALQIGLDRLEPHSVSPMARKASCHTTAGSYACRCWQNSSRNITKS